MIELSARKRQRKKNCRRLREAIEEVAEVCGYNKESFHMPLKNAEYSEDSSSKSDKSNQNSKRHTSKAEAGEDEKHNTNHNECKPFRT